MRRGQVHRETNTDHAQNDTGGTDSDQICLHGTLLVRGKAVGTSRRVWAATRPEGDAIGRVTFLPGLSVFLRPSEKLVLRGPRQSHIPSLSRVPPGRDSVPPQRSRSDERLPVPSQERVLPVSQGVASAPQDCEYKERTLHARAKGLSEISPQPVGPENRGLLSKSPACRSLA